MEILCRNCEHWEQKTEGNIWRGNCRKHPWEHTKYSETTTPNYDCQGKDYVDKYAKYAEVKK